MAKQSNIFFSNFAYIFSSLDSVIRSGITIMSTELLPFNYDLVSSFFHLK